MVDRAFGSKPLLSALCAHRRTRAALSVLLLTCLPASGLSAQEPKRVPGRWETFAEFGGSFYTTASGTFTLLVPPAPGTPAQFREDISFAKTGRLFTGVRFHLSPGNHAEVSYSYSPGRINSTISTLSPPISVLRVFPFRAHYLSFNYVRTLPRHGPLQPFLTGGLGFVAFEGIFGVEHKLAGNLGAGMDVRLGKRVFLRVEQRTFISGAPRTDTDAKKDTIYNIVPSVGLVFRF